MIGIAAFAGGCSKEQAEEEGEPVRQLDADKVVITVNGEEITDQEVAQEVSRLMQMQSRRLSPEDLEPTRRALRKDAAANAVSRLLLRAEVLKKGIKAADDEVDGRLQEIRESFGSDEVYRSRLNRMGMTEDEFRGEIAVGLGIEELIETQTAHITEPGEKELKNYYEKNLDRYTEQEQIRASHILIAFNPTDDDKVREEKRVRAGELLEQAREGANFAQLAVQNSDCPSKSQGGDLNFFRRGQMVTEFETAAFALDVGEISDIVETKFGYHIIKKTDHKEERVVPLDEAEERVKTDYGNEMKQQAIDEYLEHLRAAADIEYLDSTLVD
jgi:peptidyl-prolyl cis-trans isomerase C